MNELLVEMIMNFYLNMEKWLNISGLDRKIHVFLLHTLIFSSFVYYLSTVVVGVPFLFVDRFHRARYITLNILLNLCFSGTWAAAFPDSYLQMIA